LLYKQATQILTRTPGDPDSFFVPLVKFLPEALLIADQRLLKAQKVF